jgi:SAM-dependent methyltransferase
VTGHPQGSSDDGVHDGHAHHQGHAHDQGFRGAVRYLRLLPRLWRSEVNDAVVARVAPKPGERALDIGAGMGAAAVRAASAGAHVVAVEPTPFMRGLLRARTLPGELLARVARRDHRLELAVGAAEHLPVEDASVDAMWAVNTLHHWSDLERAVAEIARTLAPRGRVLLVDEAFSDPRHPEFHRFGGDGDHEQHGFLEIDAERLAALLSDQGLASVDTSCRELAGRPVVSVWAEAPAS